MRTAVILAAGRGTRLRPLTDHRPKCLVEVDGRTLLERLVDELAPWATRIVIVSGHCHDVLTDFVRRLESPADIRIDYNADYRETNSLGSAALTRRYWFDSDEVVISNSDVVFAPGALRAILEAEGECVAAVVRKECDGEDMKVTAGAGRIRAVSKEIEPADAFGEFTGLVKLCGGGIRSVAQAVEEMVADPVARRDAWYDLAIDRAVRSGQRVGHVTIAEPEYAEVDTLEDLREAQARFADTGC